MVYITEYEISFLNSLGVITDGLSNECLSHMMDSAIQASDDWINSTKLDDCFVCEQDAVLAYVLATKESYK